MMEVFVYRNLHKNCWSVQSKMPGSYGRILFHTKELVLDTCTLVVLESGRQKVLKEKRKNVHAGIRGTIGCIKNKITSEEIYYNPYLYQQFIIKSTKQSIKKADRIYLSEDMKVYR